MFASKSGRLIKKKNTQPAKCQQPSQHLNNASMKFLTPVTDEEDIKKDEKRMEHFQSLTVVLRSLIDEAAMPGNQELLRIFGKVGKL